MDAVATRSPQPLPLLPETRPYGGFSFHRAFDGHHRQRAYARCLRLGLPQAIRKLYYNLTIASISVLIAFAVGGVDALGLLAYSIVSHFAVSWIASILFYRRRRFDQLKPNSQARTRKLAP